MAGFKIVPETVIPQSSWLKSAHFQQLFPAVQIMCPPKSFNENNLIKTGLTT